MIADLSFNKSFHETMEHFPFQNAFLEVQEKIIKLDFATRSPIEIMQDDFKNYLGFVKFGHVNAVTGNRDELVRIFNEIALDIFSVSETNIHKNTPKSAFEIPDYRFFHQEREGNSQGAVEFM